MERREPANREDISHVRNARLAESLRTAAEALSGLQALALGASIFALLYFGRDVFMPLALSALFAFMLEPLIRWLGRWIGRTAAVVVLLFVVLAALVEFGFVMSRQLQDLAGQLPSYRGNLVTKAHDLMPAGNGVLAKLTSLSEDLRKTAEQAAPAPKNATAQGNAPLDVRVVENGVHTPIQTLRSYVEPLMGPLGTAFLVTLLVVFMAIRSVDLQERFIRLIGYGHIGTTARAIDDGTVRIRRYLGMQLLTNAIYGAALAASLHFIGVPNALLWGGLAGALRFIPYVGSWIAAMPPLLLSLAVSPSWAGPALTLGVFLALELITANVLEPWLYGSSTGVSPLALVVAAVFWATIWGPVGLFLSTPLTVCLVVLGRHIPRLEFLAVMLGEEEPLSPSEQVYRRLLNPRTAASGYETAENYVGANSLTRFYDEVLVPIVLASERDYADRRLDAEQRDALAASLRRMIEQVEPGDGYETPSALPMQPCRVVILPAHAARDALVGQMLARALRLDRFDAHAAADRAQTRRMLDELDEEPADIVIVSVLAPTTLDQARRICRRLKSAGGDQRIVVGAWRDGGTQEPAPAAGEIPEADAVVATIGETMAVCEGYLMRDTTMASEPPANPSRETQPELDAAIAETAADCGVPFAFACRIEDGRCRILAAAEREDEDADANGAVAAIAAICGRLHAPADVDVVEDLLRDRRFAASAAVQTSRLRFIAAAALGEKDILCVADTAPRVFSRKQRARLLEHAARIALCTTQPAA
ncbi:MAG TPA: AI-2E family transporter [Rudaea sp.]|nr:AI-2E family transporter [Rudaea sp.]